MNEQEKHVGADAAAGDSAGSIAPDAASHAALAKPDTGLWRCDAATPEGKYLVKRRDGSVVEWPSFVIGARDPAAPAALRAYAEAAVAFGMNERYVSDVRWLADEFETYRHAHGPGDPGKGRHRTDDPETIAEMRQGKSA